MFVECWKIWGLKKNGLPSKERTTGFFTQMVEVQGDPTSSP